MTKRSRNYRLDTNTYPNKTNRKDQIPVSQRSSNVSYVDTSGGEETRPNTTYSDITYASIDNPITPREIYNYVRRALPKAIADTSVSEDVFLVLLEEELAYFCTLPAGSEKKWNFLTAKQVLQLQRGNDEYQLSSNFKKMISVWADVDCRLVTRKSEFKFIPWEQTDFPSGVNFYSIRNNRIKFFKYKTDLSKCNNCGRCNDCLQFVGRINLHYYYEPTTIASMDQPIRWFPEFTSARKYLIEKMKERVSQKAGQIYTSPLAESFYSEILEWDGHGRTIQNKAQHDRNMFDFSKMHSRSGTSHTGGYRNYW